MLITCPKCGKSISDTLKTCIHCGENLSNYVRCPECGKFSKTNSYECSNCGYNFTSDEKERLNRKCRDCVYYNKDNLSECDMYRRPLHPDAPKCKYYSYSSIAHEHNKCYLTSACVQYYGKPDDCYELQTLRNFRDTVLIKTEEGKKLCEEYYKIAPAIVDKLHELNNCAYYEYIYAQILICIKYIENHEYKRGVDTYKEMCLKLQNLT